MVFFHGNIEYIYERVSNPTLKKILYYPFKLKYLNQNVFLSHIEKIWLFFLEHRVYIPMSFKSHIWKKKNWVSSGFCRAITTAGLLLNPDQCSHRVDQVPGQPAGLTGFNNSAYYLIFIVKSSYIYSQWIYIYNLKEEVSLEAWTALIRILPLASPFCQSKGLSKEVQLRGGTRNFGIRGANKKTSDFLGCKTCKTRAYD